MDSNFSFADYLLHKYRDKIVNAINEYLSENPIYHYVDNEDGFGNDWTIEHSVSKNNIEAKYFKSGDIDNLFLHFKVAFYTNMLMEDHDERGQIIGGSYRYQWFTLICSCSFDDDIDDFVIHQVKEYEKGECKGGLLSPTLVPYIKKENYGKAARLFLERYYEKCLDEKYNKAIDVKYITEELGLNVVKKNITEDNSVFGRIFFYETKSKFYNTNIDRYVLEKIPAKTIVLDTDALDDYASGSYDNTIIHECVHFAFHKYAMALRRLYGIGNGFFECSKDFYDVMKTDDNIMESQARGIAPKVLMPRHIFERRAKAHMTLSEKTSILIEQVTEGEYNSDPIFFMTDVIDKLVDFFNATKTAVRIRMIELGFYEAKGSYLFMDGKYVSSHKPSKDILDTNQLFAISEDNIINLLQDKVFREYYMRNNLVYVERFVCINNEKYIEYSDDKAYLTDYARTHMEECCVIFDREYDGNRDDSQKINIFLNNNLSNDNSSYSFNYDNQTLSLPDEIDLAKYYELLDYDDFDKSFFAITSKLKPDEKDVVIANDLHIGLTTLKNYRHGKFNKVEQLVGLSLYYHIPNVIYVELEEISSMHLNRRKHNHKIYWQAIMLYWYRDYKYICDFIEKRGADPLFPR